ncbi:hypothetical protein ACFLY8_01925 [Halobacteriota archaeon]
MKKLIDLGVLPIRRRSSKGYTPHLLILFKSEKRHVFGIDIISNEDSHRLLITHAHSDHYGRSAMTSQKSVASEKTAKALEILYGRKFVGTTFKVGDCLDIDGVRVQTHSTGHTIGSTAFSWENEVGTTILATGDVKDSSHLPRCDVLVTEATYGDPYDPQCRFKDDIDAFKDAIRENVAFGAYSFGKAQRAVKLLRTLGYGDEISMDSKSLELTRELMEHMGPLADLGENGKMRIVPPRHLNRLPGHLDKFVLTGRSCSHQRIQISDHLDFDGLTKMVHDCNPEVTIIYHPPGSRPAKLAQYLNENGFTAIPIDEITNVMIH